MRIESRERRRDVLVTLAARLQSMFRADRRLRFRSGKIRMRRMAVAASCRVAQAQVRRLAMERVVEGLEVLLMTHTAFVLRGMARCVGRRIGDPVGCMAVDANGALLVLLPCQTMCAVFLPVLEQNLVTAPAHFGRIMVLGRRPALVDLHDPMVTVAVAAAGRGNETG